MKTKAVRNAEVSILLFPGGRSLCSAAKAPSQNNNCSRWWCSCHTLTQRDSGRLRPLSRLWLINQPPSFGFGLQSVGSCRFLRALQRLVFGNNLSEDCDSLAITCHEREPHRSSIPPSLPCSVSSSLHLSIPPSPRPSISPPLYPSQSLTFLFTRIH